MKVVRCSWCGDETRINEKTNTYGTCSPAHHKKMHVKTLEGNIAELERRLARALHVPEDMLRVLRRALSCLEHGDINGAGESLTVVKSWLRAAILSWVHATGETRLDKEDAERYRYLRQSWKYYWPKGRLEWYLPWRGNGSGHQQLDDSIDAEIKAKESK